MDLAHGESDEHRNLKEYIAHHPRLVGLPHSCAPGNVEFIFGSADAIDVIFQHRNLWVGVEVKSVRSTTADISRGLFQSIKYGALLEATLMAQQRPVNYKIVLVIEGTIPTDLIPLRNTLGVKVVSIIRSGEGFSLM